MDIQEKNKLIIEKIERENNKKRKKRIVGDVLIVICAIILLFINLSILGSKNTFFVMSASLFIIALIFLFLLNMHRFYEKIFSKSHPFAALLGGYLVIICTMILYNQNLLSIEWAFVGFIACGIIFYDFLVDSRFMIILALIFLGYIPFLLTGQFNAFAETIAIYVYYLLVIGVLLQIIESKRKQELKLDFDIFLKKLSNKQKYLELLIIIIGLVCAVIVVANRFYSLELWKWTWVYFFFVMLAFYSIAWLLKEDRFKA
ncbi:MAG: hypothetical protein WC781_05310 [Candidatus Pacearchaeota archaeon]|jgi:hypothetical protein